VLFSVYFGLTLALSLQTSVKKEFSDATHSEVKAGAEPNSCSEDLVLKESENDGEDSLEPLFTVLPCFISFNVEAGYLLNTYEPSCTSVKENAPIFLVTRDLRI
jgi:hypothetical protein